MSEIKTKIIEILEKIWEIIYQIGFFIFLLIITAVGTMTLFTLWKLFWDLVHYLLTGTVLTP